MTKEIQITKSEQAANLGNTIFHIAERFLDEHYFFRFNTIKKEVEYKPKSSDQSWEVVNENNLFIHLQKSGIKININNLIAVLRSDFVPHFNPLVSYFKSLPKYNPDTEPDHIALLVDHFDTPSREDFTYHFRKWLVRAVHCSLDDFFFNKQAFVLVQPSQNSGKSTFCRWLCPPALSDYLAEDLTTDKDSRILITKNFLINLDELSSLHRKELNSLKALFSKDKINERLPYDRKNSILSRCCSFIGSTNLAEFLTDETGSVRWLCFEISKIDWSYKKAIKIDDIWRQAYSLYLDKDFVSAMTADDIKKNEVRNKKFQLLTVEQEMIMRLFKKADTCESKDFMTSSDVANLINTWTATKVNKMMTGRALNSLGYERVKDSKMDRYGYYIVFVQPQTSSHE